MSGSRHPHPASVPLAAPPRLEPPGGGTARLAERRRLRMRPCGRSWAGEPCPRPPHLGHRPCVAWMADTWYPAACTCRGRRLQVLVVCRRQLRASVLDALGEEKPAGAPRFLPKEAWNRFPSILTVPCVLQRFSSFEKRTIQKKL